MWPYVIKWNEEDDIVHNLSYKGSNRQSAIVTYPITADFRQVLRHRARQLDVPIPSSPGMAGKFLKSDDLLRHVLNSCMSPSEPSELIHKTQPATLALEPQVELGPRFCAGGAVGRARSRNIPSAKLYRISEATVLTLHGQPVVLDAQGQVVEVISSRYAPMIGYYNIDLAQARKLATVGPETALLASCDQNWKRYCHWMVDQVARCGILQDAQVALDRTTILLNYPERTFHQDTFRAFGRHSIPFLGLDNVGALQVKNLYVTSIVGKQLNHPANRGSEWAIQFLRDLFLPAVKIQKKLPRFLYISRRDADHRQVVSENRMIEELGTLGFKCITLTELSVDDQAAYFNSADVIVAPHGAGLSNVVFMRPGTKLVEIHGEQGTSPTFRIIAESLGVKYYSYTARSVGKKRNRADLDVELEILMDRLPSVISD